MSALLDRVRGELRRRAARPTETQVLLGYLRTDELRELRAALGETVDVATVRRLEHRGRTRRRIGLPPFFDHSAGSGATRMPFPFGYACVKGSGPCFPCSPTSCACCWCLDDALDGTRRLATPKGLRYQAERIHRRRHPEPKPEPQFEPEWA